MHYFPTNHGQSEGDSMHSVIERNEQRMKEIMVPAQLTTICKMARLHRRPYHEICGGTVAGGFAACDH